MDRTAALKSYRAGGGRIRTQRWYQIWENLYGSSPPPRRRTKRPEVVTPKSPPGGAVPVYEWQVDNPGGWIYYAVVLVQDEGDDDGGAWDEVHLSIFSSHWISHREALKRAVKITSDATRAAGSFAGQRVIGAYLTSISKLVPKRGGPRLAARPARKRKR